METETAWGPCIETYDFICKVFPSLTYYYRSEEPMMAEYLTNDNDGRYFKERYIADVNVPDGEFMVEYFNHMEEALQWIAEINRLKSNGLCGSWDALQVSHTAQAVNTSVATY